MLRPWSAHGLAPCSRRCHCGCLQAQCKMLLQCFMASALPVAPGKRSQCVHVLSQIDARKRGAARCGAESCRNRWKQATETANSRAVSAAVRSALLSLVLHAVLRVAVGYVLVKWRAIKRVVRRVVNPEERWASLGRVLAAICFPSAFKAWRALINVLEACGLVLRTTERQPVEAVCATAILHVLEELTCAIMCLVLQLVISCRVPAKSLQPRKRADRQPNGPALAIAPALQHRQALAIAPALQHRHALAAARASQQRNALPALVP